MEFHATAPSGLRRTDCAVIGVFEGGGLGAAGELLPAATRAWVMRLVRGRDFAARLGDTLLLPREGDARPRRLLLVGLGQQQNWSARSFRRAEQLAAQALVKCGARDALFALTALAVPGMDLYYRARHLAEAIAAATYRVPARKSGKRPASSRLARVGALARSKTELAALRRGLAHGAAVGTGARLARDLGNLPANICTPSYIGRAAQELARRHRRVRTRVLGLAQLQRLKMGALLSVTRGSDEPPRLVVVEYRGGGAGSAPIALVGKGVTFDSGGISLKDPPAMDEMKFDMSGAATVLGVIDALATLRAPVNVVGVMPACENMPSGRATKPGDVITSMSGQTIEVLNTDAEGRLILCDAITYVRRFRPRVVIDIATLTGACVIALGNHVSGLMSNDDGLAAALESAGRACGDLCWRLPISDDYAEQLRTNFADLANVAGREGGAITAACFLWKFAKDLRWAHLDIAGTAWLSGSAKGSTGRPVPLLVDYCLHHA
jgi:leucyl aminopeptidase